MTKKRASSPIRHLLRFCSRLIIFLFVLVCLVAFPRLHSHSKPQTPVFTSQSRCTIRDHHVQFEGPPKIASLFLVCRDLPLDFVWDVFFKVVWGESTMIEAERLLLKNALDDPANQRFVLLSDSCIPLHNFIYTYNSLMSSQKSFVDSFLDVKDKRYHPKMSPTIPKEKWRKGSQWITLVRRHAEIFPVFREFCKRWAAIDLIKRRQLLQLLKLKHHSCISNEHYVQALLAMSGLEEELERRTLTYTSWNHSATHGRIQGGAGGGGRPHWL